MRYSVRYTCIYSHSFYLSKYNQAIIELHVNLTYVYTYVYILCMDLCCGTFLTRRDFSQIKVY